MLLTLCYFFIYIIEVIIFDQYATKLYPLVRSVKCKYLSYTLSYGLLFLLSFGKNGLINTAAFAAVNIFLFCFLYGLSFFTALFQGALLTIIMSVSELIVSSTYLFDFFSNANVVKNMLFLIVTSKTCYFLFANIIALIFKGFSPHKSRSDLGIVMIIAISLLSLIIHFTLFSIALKESLSLFFNVMISLSAVILLLINLLNSWVYSYSQKKNEDNMKLSFQTQKDQETVNYYKALIEQDTKRNILIHDIKNHLSSIQELNHEGKQKEIDEYLSNLFTNHQLTTSVKVCERDLLNGIIFRYQTLCKEQQIKFFCDIDNNCLDVLKDEDLTALVCNLLDNALEATKDIRNAFIELNVYRMEQTDYSYINVINTCLSDPFNPYTHELKSRKSNALYHGYGIKSINQIAKRYNGYTDLYYTEEKHEFHAIISLTDPYVIN